MKGFYLGVDIGGSKSHAPISDGEGRAVGLGVGGPGNYEVVGWEGLRQTLQTITGEALVSAGITRERIAGAGFGIAGYDWPGEREPTRQAIEALALEAPYEFANDAVLGLLAGSAAGWGVVVVAGTSNNCYGRDWQGRQGRVTGNGPRYGEYGGAAEMMARAVQCVARAWTQRAPATALTETLIQFTGAADVTDLLEGLDLQRYQLPAAAAPLIFQLAAGGDEVARDIVRWAGCELGSLAVGVIHQLVFEEVAFDLVLAGSLYEGSPALIEALRSTVHAVAPGARLVRLQVPPVVGGVLLGMEQAGIQPGEQRETLIGSTAEMLSTRPGATGVQPQEGSGTGGAGRRMAAAHSGQPREQEGGNTMSFLQQEIRQQPQVLMTLLDQEWEHVQRIAAGLRTRRPKYVVIAARGTSDNAARYGQYVLGAHNRLPVGLATPSLFSVYGQPPNLAEGLVVGISQSGQSPDIVAVLAHGREQGAPTLAITNEPDSPLAQQAEYVIALHAGAEQAVAATKTYTAQLAALALLSCGLAEDAGRLELLRRVPLAVERVLGREELIARAVERYRYMETCVVLGRGYNYATAFEIALKLKELNYLIAESYSSADFMHGPIAVVGSGFPAMVVAPGGRMYETMRGFSLELKARGAELLIISDEEDLLAEAVTPLPLPTGVPEWLSPLVAVVPGQLFALHLTLAKGHDPDQPQGLQKVTITR